MMGGYGNLGLGTFPLGLSGLYGDNGQKLTLRDLEDKMSAWLKDTDPDIVAFVYFYINKSGVTLADCPLRIASLKKKLTA